MRHFLITIFLIVQVPWPLTYCITPTTLQKYQKLLTWLLQLHRAKYTVEHLSRTKPGTADARMAAQLREDQAEMRQFFGLRRRLLWLVRILWEFVTRDVSRDLEIFTLSKRALGG